MSLLRLKDNLTRPVALTATGLFLCAAAIFFLPVDLPYKITIPLTILGISALWLCPWQIALGLLFSALGDQMGAMGNLPGQMGSFALAHIMYIAYFAVRYFKKVERDRKLTAKAKGYLTMILLCSAALLAIAFVKIVPEAPAGILRIGTAIYACLICSMLVLALLQRSSLFALGAVLFVFSDFILAWVLFVEPIEDSRLLIMIPYYAAQWLLYIRSTSFRVGPEMRLMRF